jgi:sec-independent protein translocase protein TatB
VLALVIIGPERLPGAARKAGYFVGKARRYIEGVRSEVESELDVNEFKRMLHNQEVQINELQQQLKTGVDEIKADMPDPVATAELLADRPSSSSGEKKFDITEDLSVVPDDAPEAVQTNSIASKNAGPDISQERS